MNIRELRGGCDIALAWQASDPGSIPGQGRCLADGDLLESGRRFVEVVESVIVVGEVRQIKDVFKTCMGR